MNTFLKMTKALADGNRVRIIAALLRHESLCVCQIVELLRLATPTVSRHMAVLHGARLVQSRRDGRWVYYRLSMGFPEYLRQWLEDSVLGAEEIKADQVALDQILASAARDLCRNEKGRNVMNEQTGTMTEAIKELVAIGASIGAHCQPCLEYHIQAAVEIGVSEADIRAAVAVGHAVEKGAMAAMKKFSAEAIEEILSAARQAKNQADETAIEKETTRKVIKIYDPAMCCSSGVCGPSVDPVLTQFAATLKFLSGQPHIEIERYNLGQQPEAFVENEIVKSILGSGGEKGLPLIFIDDQLWIEGRYPSRSELLEALNIKENPAPAPVAAVRNNTSCSGEGGCC